ncbi:MAG TPA: HAMP domain-containing sensor histidine kinase [Candidatus Nanopelagicales bacterium]
MALADRLHGTPLRTRLVALLLLLVGAALVLAGAATVAALRGYLLEQVDRNVVEAAGGLASQPPPTGRPDTVRPPRPGPFGRDVLYVQRTDAAGAATGQVDEAIADPPVLPSRTIEQAARTAGIPTTVDSASGSTRWRVVTLPTLDGTGTVTVGQEIGGIDSTVQRLVALELAIGAIVLLVLGVTGWLLVRRSLRPLAEVEQTAAAIAAGDLHRRAPTSDPRTEVGSLAQSFNTMVDDLAGALAAQRASEAAAHDAAARARASEAGMRQFVADAGHELRTPLTSVRGFAELYRIGAVPPGPPLDDTMARIEHEATRMGVLVDDLLLLARLDQHRPMEVTDVPVVELVSDAIAAAHAAAPERRLELEVDPGAADLRVPGDPSRLRQVLDNLLSNALRYSPAEQPIEVRVRLVADTAELSVRDHGPGMSPEVAARAFERFYRADAARARDDGGSGLGLAIVAAIVAAHGGEVSLETAAGQGCQVTVRLPRTRRTTEV